MRNVCRTARAPRTAPAWVQAGVSAAGALVVPKSLPSGWLPR